VKLSKGDVLPVLYNIKKDKFVQICSFLQKRIRPDSVDPKLIPVPRTLPSNLSNSRNESIRIHNNPEALRCTILHFENKPRILLFRIKIKSRFLAVAGLQPRTPPPPPPLPAHANTAINDFTSFLSVFLFAVCVERSLTGVWGGEKLVSRRAKKLDIHYLFCSLVFNPDPPPPAALELLSLQLNV
jgi:hypothetical protein